MVTIPEVISNALINGTPADKRELKDLISAAVLLFITNEETSTILKTIVSIKNLPLFVFTVKKVTHLLFSFY